VPNYDDRQRRSSHRDDSYYDTHYLNEGRINQQPRRRSAAEPTDGGQARRRSQSEPHGAQPRRRPQEAHHTTEQPRQMSRRAQREQQEELQYPKRRRDARHDERDRMEYYSQPKQKQPKKKKKKKRSKLKITLIVLLVLLLVAAGIGGYFFLRFKKIYDAPEEVITATPVPEPEREYITYNGELYYENPDIARFVLFGIDSSEIRDQRGAGARTDVMIVVAVDVKQNKITGIEIPRDTKAEVDLLDQDGNVTDTMVTKINGAFQFGGREMGHGAQNSLNAINKLLSIDGKYDLKLTDYAGINIDGIGPLATAVGGVPVTLKNNIEGIGSRGETVTLKGKKAETFCRVRKGADLTGSDIDRGKRQMDFIFGFISKVRKLGIGEIAGIVSQVIQYTFTNLSMDEIVAYASVALKVPNENIDIIQLPGEDKLDGLWYFIVDEEGMEQIVIDTFYLPKDPKPTPDPNATPESTQELPEGTPVPTPES